MHVSAFTLIAICALAVWWYKPLRVFLIQRTNRTVKVLLIVFPALVAGRLALRFYNGTQDQSDIVLVTVGLLLLLWLVLMALGNWLERRRPTQARPPDFAALAKLPGMPRVAQVPGLAATALGAARAASASTPAASAGPGTGPSGQPAAATLAGLSGIPGVTRPVNVTDVQRAAELAQTAAPHVQRAAQAAAPHVQRAARATVTTVTQATADFDTKDVAGSVGRSTGRLYAKLRKSLKEGAAQQ